MSMAVNLSERSAIKLSKIIGSLRLQKIMSATSHCLKSGQSFLLGLRYNSNNIYKDPKTNKWVGQFDQNYVLKI
jgi:hypothetical protein